MLFLRGVAQFGSATGLGPVGRGFKSCHPDHLLDTCGPLAQRLEQPAHNRSVLGSTPRWPTRQYAQIAQLVEQETENLRVLGSIPSLGTTQDPDKFRIFSFALKHSSLKLLRYGLIPVKIRLH